MRKQRFHLKPIKACLLVAALSGLLAAPAAASPRDFVTRVSSAGRRAWQGVTITAIAVVVERATRRLGAWSGRTGRFRVTLAGCPTHWPRLDHQTHPARCVHTPKS